MKLLTKLYHERITEYAASFPDKTAVADPYGELSYGALESRSAALSRALAAAGIAAGDAVAVYVPYVKEFLLGAVSVFRAGAVFVPFDCEYPAERLAYMREDCGAEAVLTLKGLWEKKPLTDFPEDKVIFMDEAEAHDEKPVSIEGLTVDSPAMLLYTSGTTGKPKGVLHIHKMLLHIVDWMNIHENAEMNKDTRSGVVTSFAFVGSLMFLLGPLSKGGTVCIAPETVHTDLAYLHLFLAEQHVTHIFLPSGLASMLAEDYDISGIFVFAAGEKLRNFKPLAAGSFLIDSYGSTETSGVLSKKIYGNEERILVGKPYMGTKAMIVGEDLRPAEPGTAGELLISNEFMSRQYWHLDELTAEKWIDIDGDTWFRTGDRAMLTPGGDYDLLGRTDNMVKLRGFRIETGEVEAQISNAVTKLGFGDVKQIVVLAKTVSGTDHLVCYYEAPNDIDKKAVTEEISKHLTHYMVPDIWVRMDAFPRNTNGKVLRGELPQPKRERHLIGGLDSEVVFRAVSTAADVLGISTLVWPDDRFTDLGGTSITAMQYALRLREQGIKISGAQVLRLNSFRKIAEEAEVAYEQLWTQDEYRAIREDFAGRGEHIQKVLPISTEQDEMLFYQLIFPDSRKYLNAVFLQIDSIVPEHDLRDILSVISDENEDLRSAIVFHNVEVVQQVITDRKIPLEIYESGEFGRTEMTELRKRVMYAPIDLQQSSMMKVVCVYAENMTFLFAMAHCITVGREKFRRYLARMMELLGEKYPTDTSIRDWKEFLSTKSDTGHEEKSSLAAPKAAQGAKGSVPPDICVYSKNSGPKMLFVHTGNTGSEAYYQLADRIKDDISFAVVEPYNLYHPDKAVHGIKNIASNYIRILKKWQPEGPYILGGWCYGGVVAHEMACQLEQAGEEVKHLFMLDSHAIGGESLRELSKGMFAEVNREYFETCPLFAELRANGMLEAMISNAANASADLASHIPSVFHGPVTYFKPDRVPAGVTGDNLKYWEKMMEFEAGNYENYVDRTKLRIVHTPHEHDLMMDEPSLDIIVPEILKVTKDS